MHPNPIFRCDDQRVLDDLVHSIGFGQVFATTPNGPRVAHVPLLLTDDRKIWFHLARSNALTNHIEGMTALITVNGPDGYVSPRWYDNRDTVPTWDYVALEIEGPVTRLKNDDLEDLLHKVITKFEGQIDGEPWLANEASEKVWAGLFRGIVGFALDPMEWRPTLKLSQKKTPNERQRIAQGLDKAGNSALASLVREGVQ